MEFGGVTEKKTALKGGHLKKNKGKGGVTYITFIGGGSWEKI